MFKMVVKLGKYSNGKPMHYSVGALIERDGKYLLIDRVKVPLGFAGIAGHIDEGETPEDALLREVFEEIQTKVLDYKLIREETLLKNRCSRGIDIHHWYLYKVEIKGEPKIDLSEAKSMNWYALKEMKTLTFEPAWDYWFKKLKII